MGLDLLTSALNYQWLPAAWFDDDFWGVHFDIMRFVQHARQVMIVVPDQVHAAARRRKASSTAAGRK